MKFMMIPDVTFKGIVTPFTGVWIEILLWIQESFRCGVTPFTGVWIEISIIIPQ